MLQIVFSDAILSMNTESRYFQDFAKRVRNIDFNKEVFLSPYDFEPEKDKRLTGVSIKQGGEKIENYYWDPTEKAVCNGFPEPKDANNYSKDDWKVFFIDVRKFLVNEINNEDFQAKIKKEMEDRKSKGIKTNHSQERQDNQVQQQQQNNEVEEEIKIEDVPF
jgi:hypothetical protein